MIKPEPGFLTCDSPDKTRDELRLLDKIMAGRTGMNSARSHANYFEMAESYMKKDSTFAKYLKRIQIHTAKTDEAWTQLILKGKGPEWDVFWEELWERLKTLLREHWKISDRDDLRRYETEYDKCAMHDGTSSSSLQGFLDALRKVRELGFRCGECTDDFNQRDNDKFI
jgi:hypothetical protein